MDLVSFETQQEYDWVKAGEHILHILIKLELLFLTFCLKLLYCCKTFTPVMKGFVDGAVPYFWTSGRKCNFDG